MILNERLRLGVFNNSKVIRKNLLYLMTKQDVTWVVWGTWPVGFRLEHK